MSDNNPTNTPPKQPTVAETPPTDMKSDAQKREIGGRKGLEPTRFGDWEKGGKCVDF